MSKVNVSKTNIYQVKKSKLKVFWRENKSLIIFISLMMVFRSAVADWNDVPTGSMKPTIVEGDRILVNKMAYDIRFPFSHVSLFKIADPQRNDVIIFDSVVSDKRLVKRVIGVPGDVVSMHNNQLIINGEVVDYKELANKSSHKIMTESLISNSHRIRLAQQPSRLANFSSVKVPQNQYLVLGDNRDNSADSRVIGFVPRDEIVGRSSTVVMSLNYDNYYLPRSERFLIDL